MELEKWLEIRVQETLQRKSVTKSTAKDILPIPHDIAKQMKAGNSLKVMNLWKQTMEDKIWTEVWNRVTTGNLPVSYPAWKLPLYNNQVIKHSNRIRSCNRYLRHMHKSILLMAANREWRKIWRYGDILLRRSTAFLTWSFHKADKGWFYKFSEDKVKEYAKRQLDINRKKLDALKFIRSYIKKPNGKMRPIGAPVHGDKASLTGLAEIIKLIVEPQLGDYQFGFRTSRAAWHALIGITDKLRRNWKVFQYDLNSWFNKVNVQVTCGRLNSLSYGLGRWVLNITRNTYPRFKELYPETEIRQIATNVGMMFRRSGFTQGSPLSPILSNLALEFGGLRNVRGLIQYADDGVILREEEEVISFWDTPRARIAGMELAIDKPYGWSENFKFLGMQFDTVSGIVTSKSGDELNYRAANHKELINFFKKYGGYDEDEPKTTNSKWYWKIEQDSLLMKQQEVKCTNCKIHEKFENENFRIKYFTKKIGKSKLIHHEVHNLNTNGTCTYTPQMESTKHINYLLEYYNQTKKWKLEQVADRDYEQTNTDWWMAKTIGSRVWVQFPEEWFTLDAENKAINKGMELLRAKAKHSS